MDIILKNLNEIPSNPAWQEYLKARDPRAYQEKVWGSNGDKFWRYYLAAVRHFAPRVQVTVPEYIQPQYEFPEKEVGYACRKAAGIARTATGNCADPVAWEQYSMLIGVAIDVRRQEAIKPRVEALAPSLVNYISSSHRAYIYCCTVDGGLVWRIADWAEEYGWRCPVVLEKGGRWVLHKWREAIHYPNEEKALHIAERLVELNDPELALDCREAAKAAYEIAVIPAAAISQ